MSNPQRSGWRQVFEALGAFLFVFALIVLMHGAELLLMEMRK